MLRYAARALLNKTLTTFLRKYLLDIDVENIVIPSGLYTQQHWGLRICNVRLREGVELYTTTRTRVIKKRTRRRHVKKKTKPKKPKKKPSTTHRASPPKRRSKKKIQIPPQSLPPLPNLSASQKLPRKQNSTQTSPVLSAHTSPRSNSARKLGEHSLPNRLPHTASAISWGPNSVDEPDEDEALLSDSGASPSPRIYSRFAPPPLDTTPMIDSSFSNESSVLESQSSPVSSGGEYYYTTDSEPVSPIPPVARCSPKTAKRNILFCRSGSRKDSLPRSGSDLLQKTEIINHTARLDKKAHRSDMMFVEDNIEDDPEEEHYYSKQQQDDDSESSEEEDESEWEEVEETVREKITLRVGKGGRVGVLDVKLEGKDIYVSVEDAFLVVEADFEIIDPHTADTSSPPNTATPPSTAPAAPKAEPPQVVEDDASSGERLMKKSFLARAISAIPSLLLRDCRVRFVMKGTSNNDIPQSNQASKDNMNRTQEIDENERDPPSNAHDTVVEVGIDFLSVTSGEDFLAHARADEESKGGSTTAGTSNTNKLGRSILRTFSGETDHKKDAASATETDQNEFLRKRIRTGKGPESGIWVKVFPPSPNGKRHYGVKYNSADLINGSKRNKGNGRLPPQIWAMDSWAAQADMCLVRFSGLDLQARIYLGEKEKMTIVNNVEPWGYAYDDYALDSTLFGVDYVGPVMAMSMEKESRALEGEEKEELMTNSIQSVDIKSHFHRLARGLRPCACQKEHMLSDECCACWTGGASTSRLSQRTPMDSCIPLPGLVIYLSILDPLEININRESLKALGQIISIFTKDKGATDTQDHSKLEKTRSDNNDARIPEKDNTTPSTITKDKTKSAEEGREELTKEMVDGEEFPYFMKPETVHVIGIHASAIIFRLHSMVDKSTKRMESGRSYSYWDGIARAVTVDVQQLVSSPLSFKDIILDVGHIELDERKGVERKKLLSLGLRPSGLDDLPSHHKDSMLWPCTSSALLSIPAPIETCTYASRDNHAFLLRYIGAPDPIKMDALILHNPSDDSGSVRFIDCKVGTMNLDAQFAIKNEILAAIRETIDTLFIKQTKDEAPKPKPKPKPNPKPTGKGTEWEYKLQLDGGSLCLEPIMQLNFPSTQLLGQKSPTMGFLLKSVLNQFGVQVGRVRPSFQEKGQLSLQHLVKLPESVRMRIFLFCDDLIPLQQALRMKASSLSPNIFLQTRAINKHLLHVASGHRQQKEKVEYDISESPPPDVDSYEFTNTRSRILSELMTLGDSALEQLWNTYQQQAETNDQTGS